MNAEEPSELHALGTALAATASSPWQPRCVARAFTAPAAGTLALTMGGWLELDARRSVLLLGELPRSIAELEAALPVFGLARPAEFSPEETADLAAAMLRAVRGAFATAVKMEAPERRGSAEGDGFGDWIAIYAFLVVPCGLSPDAALALRVDCALALIAAHRHNQGWRVNGTPYALRDLAPGDEEAAHE